MREISVTSEQIKNALGHVQAGIEAGRNGTDVELTATGVLVHTLMALGITLDEDN